MRLRAHATRCNPDDMRSFACIVALAAGLMAWPTRVAAGPVEQVAQFAAQPDDPDVMVLRHEYGGEGLIFTRDGGVNWQLMCGSALQPTGLTQTLSRLGPVAFDADGVLHMGTFGGLLRDDATGCAWTSESTFADQWVSDVTRHPTDASILFAITSSGGEGKMNGVYRRDGATAQWKALGTQDAILISRLFVVELGGGKLRLYEGAVRGMLGMAPNFTPNYITRVSDDLGETWTEHEFGQTDGTVRLEAVDPKNPDRIVVVVDHEGSSSGVAGAPDDILISDDQGATFTTWTSVVSFGGLAIAPDGRAWFGDTGDSSGLEGTNGLFAAASLGAKATLLSSELHVTCLHYLPAAKRLFACDRFEAGFVIPDDGTYTQSFAFREVASFIDCPDRDLPMACERQLLSGWCGITHFPEADLCCNYSAADKEIDPKNLDPTQMEALCPGDVDAGATGGTGGAGAAGGVGGHGGTGGDGADAGPLPLPPAKKADSGGCGVADQPPRAAATWAVALGLALAFVARRVRRTRR